MQNQISEVLVKLLLILSLTVLSSLITIGLYRFFLGTQTTNSESPGFGQLQQQVEALKAQKATQQQEQLKQEITALKQQIQNIPSTTIPSPTGTETSLATTSNKPNVPENIVHQAVSSADAYVKNGQYDQTKGQQILQSLESLLSEKLSQDQVKLVLASRDAVLKALSALSGGLEYLEIVKKGDNLETISQKLKLTKKLCVDPIELARFNGITDPKKISPGQKIKIPNKPCAESLTLSPNP